MKKKKILAIANWCYFQSWCCVPGWWGGAWRVCYEWAGDHLSWSVWRCVWTCMELRTGVRNVTWRTSRLSVTKMISLLKIACKSHIMLHYHPILDSIILSIIFFSVSTGFIFIYETELMHLIFEWKIILDNFGIVHSKTKLKVNTFFFWIN